MRGLKTANFLAVKFWRYKQLSLHRAQNISVTTAENVPSILTALAGFAGGQSNRQLKTLLYFGFRFLPLLFLPHLVPSLLCFFISMLDRYIGTKRLSAARHRSVFEARKDGLRIRGAVTSPSSLVQRYRTTESHNRLLKGQPETDQAISDCVLERWDLRLGA